jgi:hypothetical protein
LEADPTKLQRFAEFYTNIAVPSHRSFAETLSRNFHLYDFPPTTDIGKIFQLSGVDWDAFTAYADAGFAFRWRLVVGHAWGALVKQFAAGRSAMIFRTEYSHCSICSPGLRARHTWWVKLELTPATVGREF